MAGKGNLTDKGWEVGSRARITRGTLEEVNAANNKLIKQNTALREEAEALQGENVELRVEIEALKAQIPDPVDPGGASAEIQRLEAIGTALGLLDQADDKHWTDENLPRVEAVCAIMEDDTVTRAEIDAALPGFTRAESQ